MLQLPLLNGFPGIRLHRTRDLVNWETLPYPLTRLSQLNLAGNPSSGGIWAPALSYADGIFYLIYTDVKTWKGGNNCPAHDNHNYLVTAENIRGPWSEPTYLNSSGFDPSLFHAPDGRKWLVNMEWDYRAIPEDPGNEQTTDPSQFARYFGGILLQEYDPQKRQLTGDVHKIFTGTELGFTEGPHLYHWRDKYYLLTAEGGTSYAHAVTLARSDRLFGPYEVRPQNPLLTAAGRPDLLLQKAGHGSICQTEGGDWLLFHLCGRPLTGNMSEKGAEKGTEKGTGKGACPCPLGRETAVQPLEWKDDDWLYIRGDDRGGGDGRGGGSHNAPLERFDIAGDAKDMRQTRHRTDFDEPELPTDFQSLRIPVGEEWCSLKEHPGFLRLYGQEGFSSQFRQSVIARRQQDFCYMAETSLNCTPTYFQQMAGLIVRYDEENQYYLRISYDEKLGRVLGIIIFDGGRFRMPLSCTGGAGEIPLPQSGAVRLRVVTRREKLRFYYSVRSPAADSEDAESSGKTGKTGTAWKPVGPVLPADILSDEHAYPMGFTGTFVGMACHDMSGRRMPADFDYFLYEEGDFSLIS